jgi:hypothetical protein
MQIISQFRAVPKMFANDDDSANSDSDEEKEPEPEEPDKKKKRKCNKKFASNATSCKNVDLKRCNNRYVVDKKKGYNCTVQKKKCVFEDDEKSCNLASDQPPPCNEYLDSTTSKCGNIKEPMPNTCNQTYVISNGSKINCRYDNSTSACVGGDECAVI